MKEIIKEYKNEVLEFLKNKKFIVILVLVSILSYGFAVTNFSISIDDLSLDRYVNDTYILSQGRWGTFLVYNILQIREFTPFWLDFLVVLILMCTAIFLCAFFKRVSNSNLKNSSYIIFACSYISCPVISNFFTYQPTNLTVALSNLLVIGVTACLYENFIKNNKIKINLLLSFILTFSISMYECCAQTFVVMMFIISFIFINYNKNLKFKEILKFYLNCLICLIIGIVFHYVIKFVLLNVLELLNLKKIDFSNNKTMIDLLKEANSFLTIQILLERKFTELFSSGMAWYFLCFSIIGIVLSIIQSVKKKDFRIFLIYLFIICSNFILLLLMIGNLFRVCYSFAITVGFTLLFINESVKNKKEIFVQILIALVILIQSKTMNQLFYNSYRVYKRDEEYVSIVISELLKIDENLSKPILFVKSETSLKEDLKIDNDNGDNYFIWGIDAFCDNCVEIVKFFEQLGYKITVVENRDEALETYENLSDEEKEGSVIELENFVVVKIY